MQPQPSDPQQPAGKRVVVVGAGIIGASVAYQLAKLGQKCTVMEQCEIACAASGKSGGFLAKDWCDSTATKLLARPSFEMHRKFASSLSDDIDYRALEAYSVSLANVNSPSAARQRYAKNVVGELTWLDGQAKAVSSGHRIGTMTTTAQVHPAKLTHALLAKAKMLVGSEVQYGRVEDIKHSADGSWEMKLNRRDGEEDRIQCDNFVLAMGPWSIRAKAWFPDLPAIIAQKAASLVVKAEVPATALFTQYINSRGDLREPEAYPRQDEVYLCQSAVPEDLPDNPNDIDIDDKDVADLEEFALALSTRVSGAAKDSSKVVAQACNLPVSPDGTPVIGAVPGTAGTGFIGTGHSCWGILNSPATGKAIAEIIVLGKSSIDISAFCPSRFI